MKNDLSHAEMVGCALSPGESVGAGRFSEAWRENEESWVYLHLSCAASRRRQVTRQGMKDYDCAALHAERHRALARALDHVGALRRAGFDLPHDLEQMLNNERR